MFEIHTSIHTQRFNDQIKSLQLIKTDFFNKTNFSKYNNLQSENNPTKKKQITKRDIPSFTHFHFRN